MTDTFIQTSFSLGQKELYHGKVRDVYVFEDLLIVIATDRISAFDVVLPKAIPYKGQVLNQVAGHFLEATKDILPNWVLAMPDPNVTVGKKCIPFKVEMVIRAYLSGHVWREYKEGKRELCGVPLPDGMRENDPFPLPIITPSTKADVGHDIDISREEIIFQNLVPEPDYLQIEEYVRKLFQRGQEMAAQQGLILADTKYEFGKDKDGNILLIDEIHTPDSSRYFYKDGYAERQKAEMKQKQLSKEFVREWLMQNGFQGKPSQKTPEMPADFIASVSDRYIELFEIITGRDFIRLENTNISERIRKNLCEFMKDSPLFAEI